MGLLGWLAGPMVMRDDDAATTIEAEDAFDLALCRAPIRAPTLILAGREDRFYAPELFEETARLIPGSRLCLLDGRGHRHGRARAAEVDQRRHDARPVELRPLTGAAARTLAARSGARD
jgi:pimeloyl-ACP methyl ester carboxylesterase